MGVSIMGPIRGILFTVICLPMAVTAVNERRSVGRSLTSQLEAFPLVPGFLPDEVRWREQEQYGVA
jgi:hypothetical protein